MRFSSSGAWAISVSDSLSMRSMTSLYSAKNTELRQDFPKGESYLKTFSQVS